MVNMIVRNKGEICVRTDVTKFENGINKNQVATCLLRFA